MQPKPHVSIILPCYHHGRECKETVVEILRTFRGNPFTVDIIIVSDGGADETAVIVNALAEKHHEVRSLLFSKRLGKGGAIREGVRVARGKYIAFLDADMAIHPRYLPKFVELLERNSRTSIVVGERTQYETKIVRKILSWIFRMLNAVLFWLPVRDTQAGIKAFRAERAKHLFRALRVHGYAFDLALLAEANLLGMEIVSLPVVQRRRSRSNVTLRSMFHMLEDTLFIYRRIVHEETWMLLHGHHHTRPLALWMLHCILYPLSLVGSLLIAFICLPFDAEHPKASHTTPEEILLPSTRLSPPASSPP